MVKTANHSKWKTFRILEKETNTQVNVIITKWKWFVEWPVLKWKWIIATF